MPSVFLQPRLSQFFQNLPFIPLMEVSKHLKPYDLMKLSFLSDNWKQTIVNREWKEPISIRFECKEEITKLVMKFAEHENYEIEYFRGDVEDVELRDDGSIDIITQRPDNVINRQIFEVCHFWESKFDIHLGNFDPEDATWMSRSDLLKFNFSWADLTLNRFTARDFNAFLHNWVNGFNEKVIRMSFRVGEDVKIEEVIRGLITEKWDPKKRDRKFIVREIDEIFPAPIDLEHGHDIYSTSGKHGTVHIHNNTLHFCVWNHPFSIESLVELLNDIIKRLNGWLNGSTDYQRRQIHLESRRKTLQSLRNIRGDQELQVNELQ